MHVAFDLDDTLIPSAHSFLLEAPLRPWLARLVDGELLRRGTGRVFRHLRERGCILSVYTTSFRNPLYLKVLFLAYGARLRGVINQTAHMQRFSPHDSPYRGCIKYPPAFGFNLLVDDSEWVREEGRRYNYQVIAVRPDDDCWEETVIAGVEKALAQKTALR